MKYFPEPVPYTDDLPYIREWLGREFSNILVAFEGVEMIQLTEDHINPTDPRDGMIKFADGTNWDPGQGRGFYAYRDSGWHKLDLGGSGADPNLVTTVNFVLPSGARVVQIPGDTNGAIELGRVDGNTSTPLIDFHTSATPTDYNVRLIASGTSSVNGSGQLDVHASGGLNLIYGRLNFPATQQASTDANTLDDYEEGTWTPVLRFGGASTGITYSVQEGSYVKAGQIVLCWFRVVLTSKGTATGNATIIGLPFTSSSVVTNGPYDTGVSAHYTSMAALNSPPLGYVQRANTLVNLMHGSATTIAAQTDANWGDTTQFLMTVTYRASA